MLPFLSMYSLIRDFIAAVTDHRQVWCIDARRATEVSTMTLCAQIYIFTNPTTLGDYARL